MAESHNWDIDKLSHTSDGSYVLFENFEEAMYGSGSDYNTHANTALSVFDEIDNMDEMNMSLSFQENVNSFTREEFNTTINKINYNERIYKNFEIPEDIELEHQSSNLDEIPSKLYEILCMAKQIIQQMKMEENSNNFGKFYDFPYLFYHQCRKSKGKTRNTNKRVAETMPSIYYVISQNNFNDAIEMCKDLALLEPKSTEPLRTLAFLYRELGQSENSVKCSFAAALLAKNDPVLWHDLGVALIKSGDEARGMDCLMKAFRQYPKFLPNIWDTACELYRRKDYTRTMFVLLCLAKYSITDLVYHNINMMKLLFIILPKSTDYKRIGEDIEIFLNNIYPITDYDLLTMYSSQLIEDGNYERLYRNLIKFMAIPEKNDSNLQINDLNIADISLLDSCNLNQIDQLLSNSTEPIQHLTTFPVELLANFLILIIHCGKSQDLLWPLLEHVCNYPKDLYYEEKRKLIKALGQKDMMSIVVKTGLLEHSDHLLDDEEIRLYLIDMYLTSSQWRDIIYLCDSAISKCTFDPIFLLFKIYSFYADNNHTEALSAFVSFIKCSIGQFLIKINSKPYELLKKFMFKLFENSGNCFLYTTPVYSVLLFTFSLFTNIDEISEIFKLTYEEIAKIFKNIVIYLYESGRYKEALEFPKSFNLISRKQEDNLFEENILTNSYFLTISVSLKLKKYETAFDSIQHFLEHHSHAKIATSNNFWNLVSIIYKNAQNTIDKRRQRRFMHSLEINCIGHLLMKSYMNSMLHFPNRILDDSLMAIQAGTHYSLPYLMHGLQLLQLSYNKENSDIAALAFQGLLFIFSYFNKSGGYSSQEALYNMGRAFHELGLTTLAVTYYRDALAFNIKPTHQGNSGLNREIAYNLSLIYNINGNKELALNILNMYCTL